jgi:hypothetical protein
MLMKFSRLLSLAVLCFSPVIVFAQDIAQKPEMQLDMYTWSKAAFGEPETKMKFGGGFAVRFDVPSKASTIFGGGKLNLDSLPTQVQTTTDNYDALGTWGDYIEASFFLGKRIREWQFADGSRFQAGPIMVGSATFKGWGDLPAGAVRRSLRSYGVGLEFRYVTTQGRESYVRMIYGRDEGVGRLAWGQGQLDASIRIHGQVSMVARAGLGFGPASFEGDDQSDYVTTGFAIDVPGTLDLKSMKWKAIRK